VAETAAPWPGRADLDDHRTWRPEWEPGRVCLYWYLTFGDDLVEVLDRGGLEAVRRTDWLDAVPAQWLHVTLCDVGFADELTPGEIERVVQAGRTCVAEARRLHLRFGTAAPMDDAVALPVSPPRPLRHLQHRLRSATDLALAVDHRLVHRDLYPPHLSLGYAKQQTAADEVASVLGQVGPATGQVTVDRLVLAAVSRDHGHYEWSVLAELPMGAAAETP
jgi:hypothetical protein